MYDEAERLLSGGLENDKLLALTALRYEQRARE